MCPETAGNRGWTLADRLPVWLGALTAAQFAHEERGLETSNLPTEGSSGQDSSLFPPRWSVERSQHHLPGAHEKTEKGFGLSTSQPLLPALHPELGTQARKQPLTPQWLPEGTRDTLEGSKAEKRGWGPLLIPLRLHATNAGPALSRTGRADSHEDT